MLAVVPLDLVVPDLFPPSPASTDAAPFRLPALERWLSRAQASREPGMTARRWVAARYGLKDPVPYAALSLAGESGQIPALSPVLRADPVHLAVGQDSLTLHEAAMLEVTPEEARALVSSLNELFREDGFEFVAASPERWYVRIPEAEVPSTTPLEEVAGRNVFRKLPRGEGRTNWGSALTETQMLFAAHAVNAAREAAGRPAINGVWFWGEGTLDATPPRAYDAVHGGDEVVRGLARLTGAPHAVEQGSMLCVLDAPSRALRAGDSPGWQRELEAVEAQWFATLDELARRHGSARLVVPEAESTRIFTAGPKPLLSWPRSPRAWTTYA